MFDMNEIKIKKVDFKSYIKLISLISFSMGVVFAGFLFLMLMSGLKINFHLNIGDKI